MTDSKPNERKCGIIALIGAPNAGKSTLLNNLVGSKISIVTPKVQTTRTRVTGITLVDEVQLVFIDTPGIFKPRKQLDKSMVKAAWGGLQHVDVSILLVDAKKGICENTRTILRGMEQRGGVQLLLLNKVDTVDKPRLLALAQEIQSLHAFDAVFMVSALKGDGVEDVKQFLAGKAPEGPWLYPEDDITDMPQRMLAAEVTREKLMLRLNQELPYQLMVETESWEEDDKAITIRQVVYVTTDRHKKMIVGKGGQAIRDVGEQSRKELAWMLEKKVHLYLFVKVQPNWMSSREHFAMMGLDW